jgi:hypothetical protein
MVAENATAIWTVVAAAAVVVGPVAAAAVPAGVGHTSC